MPAVLTTTRVVGTAIAAALALAVPAAADPPRYGIVHVKVPPGTPSIELGRQLYGGNCATCHGSNGEGITRAAPAARGAGAQHGQGPSLVGVGARAADFYLRTGFMPLERPGAQPVRSRVLFSEREIQALVDYVSSLGNGPPVPQPHPERGNLAEGLHLFRSHCAGCHQIVAEGGYVTGARVPPLEDASAVEIAEAVRIGPYVMPAFSESELSDDQLDSVIAYVQYAKHPDDRGGWALGHLGPVPEGLVAWFLAAAALVATCVLIGKRLSGGPE
jgi:ubiquinol-cytochrome c reductase cytochrome c subunit